MISMSGSARRMSGFDAKDFARTTGSRWDDFALGCTTNLVGRSLDGCWITVSPDSARNDRAWSSEILSLNCMMILPVGIVALPLDTGSTGTTWKASECFWTKCVNSLAKVFAGSDGGSRNTTKPARCAASIARGSTCNSRRTMASACVIRAEVASAGRTLIAKNSGSGCADA
jgi:hypothetical protein